MNHRKMRRRWALAGLAAGSLLLAACSSADPGTPTGSPADPGSEAAAEPVELSILVDNTDLSIALAEGVTAAFTAANPEVTFDVQTRPQGGEGDNVVKTRLATGDMTDLFAYNSGSLLQALNPTQTLVPLTGEALVANLSESFVPAVTTDDQVFGVPLGSAMGGAILYNKDVYADLGLEVPLTWDDFMANNAKIASSSDVAPIIQTYQDTWTSQLFVLGDFHNVLAEVPTWADDFTANRAKFATTPAALRGFQNLQAVFEAGYLNDDFASATYADGVRMVANGEGAHYPMLTFATPEIIAANPDAAESVGLFAIPGPDAATNGLTVWSAGAIYLPASTQGAKLEAAKRFLAFVASTDGCAAQTAAAQPSGPYQIKGCTLPDDVPAIVSDMLPYFDRDGGTSPALEFLSPVKGPALEQITVEVGSGIRSAEDGAALYDQDVEKQAQQLGLEGW